MLFDSSLRKELARNLGTTLVVLVTVLLTMTLIRVLGQASRGTFNPADVMLIMGYGVITLLPNVLNLAVFISVVVTLARLYAESEMIIWFSSRLGLARLLLPMLRFAWPVLLAAAALSLYAVPWAKSQINELSDRYAQRNDLERMTPGRYQESADGTRVFFVEQGDLGNFRVNNVFVATNEQDRRTVISARHGYTELVNGDRYLLLEDGQRLEKTRPDSEGDSEQAIKIYKFEHARILIEDATRASDFSVGSRPTVDLLRDPTPRNQAELFLRIGYALTALHLMVFALAYTRINPRVGRTSNLLFSIPLYFVLENLVLIGRNAIARGQMPLMTTIVLLHGGLLMISLLWLAKRHNNWVWDWRRLIPGYAGLPGRKRSEAASAS